MQPRCRGTFGSADLCMYSERRGGRTVSTNQEPVRRTTANERAEREHLASGQLSQCKAQPALKCIDRSSLAPAPSAAARQLFAKLPPAVCRPPPPAQALQTPPPCRQRGLAQSRQASLPSSGARLANFCTRLESQLCNQFCKHTTLRT